MLLTVSGLPGSGTSTVARAVAARLGVEHLDGGTVFRALAAEHGVSLAEFAARAESDDAIDRRLDDRLTQRARQGDVLLESRLAGWLVTRASLVATRAWIHCDELERARRVAARENTDPAGSLAENRAREASERARYAAYYGIDLADRSIYDVVLDSTATSVDELVDALVSAATADR